MHPGQVEHVMRMQRVGRLPALHWEFLLTMGGDPHPLPPGLEWPHQTRRASKTRCSGKRRERERHLVSGWCGGDRCGLLHVLHIEREPRGRRPADPFLRALSPPRKTLSQPPRIPLGGRREPKNPPRRRPAARGDPRAPRRRLFGGIVASGGTSRRPVTATGDRPGRRSRRPRGRAQWHGTGRPPRPGCVLYHNAGRPARRRRSAPRPSPGAFPIPRVLDGAGTAAAWRIGRARRAGEDRRGAYYGGRSVSGGRLRPAALL